MAVFEGFWTSNQPLQRPALWKLPQPWKSKKVAFGDFYLMISTAAWKSCRKKRSGFSTVPTALPAFPF
jgi:hypothetical protein